MNKIVSILIILSFVLAACKKNQEINNMLDQKVAQFSTTLLKYDESILDDRQKIVVAKLVEAAKVMDDIFLEQVFSKNAEIKSKLGNSKEANDQTALKYFEIMYGPFDRLDHNHSFYGDYKKPAGANFYPEDMTKEEFEKWIEDHPQEREAFVSEFTVIRRKDDKLVAIQYSEFYKGSLTRPVQLL